MFSKRSNINHLVDVHTAKLIVKEKLEPRITTYEERMAKPFFERAWEYCKTGLGKHGYERTKDFFEDMKRIAKTSDLIDLINQKKYQDGTMMPSLLQEAVLSMCHFTNQHVALIISDIREPLQHGGSRYLALDALYAESRALDRIYEEIVSSADYGASYLINLNSRLDKNYVLKDL